MKSKNKSIFKPFIRKILLSLNILVAIVMLIGFVAAYIPPDKCWLIAFAGLVFPYFVIVNVAFIIFWIFVKKSYSLVSLFFIIAFYTRISSFYQFNATKEIVNKNNIISVMSYNVQLFDRYSWKNNVINSNGLEITNIINSNDPDVICMQEYHEGVRNKSFISDLILKKKYIHFVKVKNKNNIEKPYGIAIYSKFPIITSKSIAFETNSVNKCFYSDIKINNDTIRFFNIHLESIKFSKEDYLIVSELSRNQFDTLNVSNNILKIANKLKGAYVKRANQTRLVKMELSKSPYPIIVCGDFNDTPASYAYNYISNDLSDAFKMAGNGFGNTYAGSLPSFRIDYILHSKLLETINYKTIKKKYSDHYPIIANIRINKKMYQ